MEIITKLPTYSDGEVNRALIQEIKTGFQLIKAREKLEEIKAAKEAEELKNHRTLKSLGKCVAVIPQDEWFRLQSKYGRDEVHSREFLSYFGKKFPHLAPYRA